MLLIKLAALFFFSVSLGISLNSEARDVYLGIAESGKGESFAGHSFLSFSDSNPLLGTVYTYGVAQPIKTLRLTGDHVSAMVYYQNTAVRENRTLYYFKLKLTDAEATLLEQKAQEDLAFIKSGNESYSIIKNNCLTHILDLINQVVSSEKQFHWNDWDEIKLRVPYFVPLALEKHPLIDGAPYVLVKFDILQTQNFYKQTLPALVNLGKCQDWSKETLGLVGVSTAMAVKQRQISFLASIRRLDVYGQQTCQAESKAYWASIYNLIPLQEEALRSKIQSWINGESE